MAPKPADKPAGQPTAQPAPAPSPAAKPAAGQTYQQGRDAQKPPALPGVPQTMDAAVQTAQRSVQGGQVGATLDTASTAFRSEDIEVQFDAGSQLSASIGWGGLNFSSHPGILVKVRNAPDVRIDSIRWSFAEARFQAQVSSDGADLFGLIGRIGQWKVQQVLDQKLKPLLPAAVQRPGYTPQQDPNLTATMGQMRQMFAFSGGGQDGMAGKLSAPSASLDVSMPDDFVAPLGASGLELRIAKGTSIGLQAQGAGKAQQPTLDTLRLSAGDKGIQILPKEGAFAAFKELDLHGVTIGKGGVFSFDYDLSAEGAIQGLMALGQLLGLAAGAQVSGQVPDVKLHAIRAEIDAKLQAEVPPRFRTFLSQYDGLVPGFSLKQFFGT